MSYTVRKVVMPSFDEFGKTKHKWEEIILSILQNCGPGIIFYLSGFYVVLHVVQNLFAEILCFGDRLFYEDWWTSTGFLNFFRSWNILVGDWLYTYIYKEIYESLIPSKSVAKFSVFIISAVVHEWIIYNVFQFFFPVIFFEMMLSGSLAMLKTPKHSILNILLW